MQLIYHFTVYTEFLNVKIYILENVCVVKAVSGCRTGSAGLPVCLQVDAGGTGTAGGVWDGGQETQVAAAAVAHSTRVPHWDTDAETQFIRQQAS